jgi:hypothetical protein
LNARIIALLSAALLLTPARAATCQVQASLVISQPSVIFPKTPVGSKLPPVSITVSNPTSSTILLEETIVSGIDFAETTDCGKELAAGARCSIQIVFQPATSGERIGNLVIAASDNNLPHFVPLTGTGE